jgi:hypothetical protein
MADAAQPKNLQGRMPVHRNTFYYDAKSLDEGTSFLPLSFAMDTDLTSLSYSLSVRLSPLTPFWTLSMLNTKSTIY